MIFLTRACLGISRQSIDTYRSEEDCWTALESMPAEQFALLQYIIGFLRELLAHSAENK